jgi:acyl carrier protein
VNQVQKGHDLDRDAVISEIKTILRRDLKIGDVEIPDDMPLVGGEFDLDSLDLLLLVTNIEKAFNFKIPNEAVSHEAFSSVSTLADYIIAQAS